MARAPTAHAGFPAPKPLAFVVVLSPCAQLNTKVFVLSTKIFVLSFGPLGCLEPPSSWKVRSPDGLAPSPSTFKLAAPPPVTSHQSRSFATSPQCLVVFSLDTTAHSRHNPAIAFIQSQFS